MPVTLSEYQKKVLLQVYIESSLLGAVTEEERKRLNVAVSYPEHYQQVNKLLKLALIPIQLNIPGNIHALSLVDNEHQIRAIICQHIPGNELHELLYSVPAIKK